MVDEIVVPCVAEDGTLLRVLSCGPDNAPVVLLAHGITTDLHEDGEPSEALGLFDLLVDQLSTLGFATVRFDFRGHGRSGGTQREVRPSTEAQDLSAVVELVKRPGRPILMVAASFGAVPTVMVANGGTQFDVIVLLNPVVDLRRTFVEPETPWAKESFHSEALESLGQRGFLLLDGTFEIDKRFVEECASIDTVKMFKAIEVPTFWIHGSGDTYVSFEIAKDAAADLPQRSFVELPGGEHGFGDEVGRRAVVSIVAHWLAAAARLRGWL